MNYKNTITSLFRKFNISKAKRNKIPKMDLKKLSELFFHSFFLYLYFFNFYYLFAINMIKNYIKKLL